MTPSIWSTARFTDGRPSGTADVRTPFEQDFDRLLFSTPVRRLGDKTQVFPLERNDSVRTRLTHSHEVSNLAKSIGTRLIRTDSNVFGSEEELKRAGCEMNDGHPAPVILAAVGLAHDLGNPPFGHQGEVAIRGWFLENSKLFEEVPPGAEVEETTFTPVPEIQRSDFTKFEGNAQALRLVSRLQNTSGPAGLNLTAATLAALMKYPVASHETRNDKFVAKKHGYFDSERDVVHWIREKTGLASGQRHPLTWIMEASDDVAYSVLDVEDAIKKGLVSAEDLLAFLREKFRVTDLGGLTNQLCHDFSSKADNQGFSLSRVREIKATYLRTRLVERLVSGAANAYLQNKNKIHGHTWTQPLLECDSMESELCLALKSFARAHAYQSPGVLELEFKGSLVIKRLMDEIWFAISNRKKFAQRDSKRLSARSAYVYSLISDSYRWHFEQDNSERLSTRYRELQLLSDMLSGMTDGFALDLHERITRYDRG